MRPEKINLLMAELEGWKQGSDGWYNEFSHAFRYSNDLPFPYIRDLNAVARVVDKLPAYVVSKYHNELAELCRIAGRAAIDAPADLRCEAILRATGKWEG